MKKIPFILLLVLLSGCGSSSSDDSIDLTKRDNISITDFIDHIDVVQLETNDQCLLSNIRQSIIYEDNFYILDSKQSLFCFSKTGEFKYKISSVGRGPEEYIYINHFNIDPFNNRLMLVTTSGSILYYNLDGNFIKKETLPSECRAYNEVYAINKDTLLFISLSYFSNIYYSHADNKIIKTMFPSEDSKFFNATSRTYQYKGSVYFNSLNQNEVYNVSAADSSIAYKWNFNEPDYTEKQITELNSYVEKRRVEINEKILSGDRTNIKFLTVDEIIGNGKFVNYHIINSQETSRYRLAWIYVEGGSILVCCDKNEKKYFVITETTEGIIFQPNITDESFIFWNRPNYKTYDSNLLNDRQMSIINSHDEERDNPFLVVYHLKQ